MEHAEICELLSDSPLLGSWVSSCTSLVLLFVLKWSAIVLLTGKRKNITSGVTQIL